MAIVYNTIYKGEFCDKSGDNIFVELKKRMLDTDPVPEIEEIIFVGEDSSPVMIDYADKGDLLLESVNGSGCTINIKAVGDFELSSLYTADEREWKTVISGAWSFDGWLIPDSCSEPYASKPYDVSVKGTDAIGTLEDLPFLKSDGTKYKGFISDKDVLRFALEKTGLLLPLSIAVNTFETTMDTSRCPLIQSFINCDAFIDDEGNAFSCYEVIRSIAARYSARLHQFGGRWQLVNVMEKSVGNVKSWNFDSNGVAIASSFIGNTVNGGGITEDLQPIGDVSFAKALASATSYYRYGYPSNELLNGNMDTWTTNPIGLPDGWITEAGAVAHTETRVADGVPTTDRFIVIDSSGANGRIKNTNTVLVRAGERVKVTFDMYAPDAYFSAPGLSVDLYLGVLITDGAGNYFKQDGWSNQGIFYVIKYKSTALNAQIGVDFTVNARNEDYSLYFGVQSIQAGAGSGDFSTRINNVSIAPSVTSDQTKPPVGMFDRQTSLTIQTYKKQAILILHGDEPNEKRTSQISINPLSLPNPIVTPSLYWKRAGITEAKPLLHIIANSELRLHGKPYRIFEALFIGFGLIDINTLLTVEFLSDEYIFLSGSFDLKSGRRTLRFAQVFNDDIPFTEEIKEDYGTEKDKNGVSVGVPTGVNPPSPGSSNIDLENYALKTDIPVKASAVETAAGTNDDKFITPFKLLGWWTNIKTLAATISGLWNFTTRPTFNGNGLITAADLPAPVDISGKANINSPTFTGDPKSPTPTAGDNDTSIATTAFVATALTNALSTFRAGDNVLIKSANYTVVSADFGANGNVTIYVDTTSGMINITLPSAVVMNGYTANIIKTSADANSISVIATINGITNDTISNQYDASTYKSNSTAIFKF